MVEHIYSLFLESTGICTDTRKIAEGNLFLALKGPNFDANRLAGKALEAGALAAIIDDKQFEVAGKTIIVDDCLTTLQELAKHHRRQLDIPFIGLTGSNGKTTTKELIYAALSRSYRAFATEGNLNNHIGVPLSVLSVSMDHQIAIIEMGANHVGEIAQLCSIARPSHGLITNIGKAHIGLFGGFDKIIQGKSELYHYLIQNQGVIFVNQHQDILLNMSKRMDNPVFYPDKGSFCPARMLEADPFVKIELASGRELTSQLAGAFNFDNMATALCVAKYFDVPETKAAEAVAHYLPSNNRSQIVQKGSNTILLDAYNANPSSMEKAVETLSKSGSKNKVAIVGDMFELGEDTKKEHENVGRQLKNLGIERVYFCGQHMKHAFDVHGGGYHAEDTAALKALLSDHMFSDATILIKASRGMALEQVLDSL
jgi:UDP-N-acetylmuramoyl-tripeptide--D-alanyl-D-alanine ligase